MHFLFSYFLSEFLVLLLGDSLVIYTLKELLNVLQVILAEAVCVEVSVEVGDGSLGIQLAFVLGLGDGAIIVLGLSDNLSDCAFSWRGTR